MTFMSQALKLPDLTARVKSQVPLYSLLLLCVVSAKYTPL